MHWHQLLLWQLKMAVTVAQINLVKKKIIILNIEMFFFYVKCTCLRLVDWIHLCVYIYFLKCFHSHWSDALFLLFLMVFYLMRRPYWNLFPNWRPRSIIHSSPMIILLFCTNMNVNQNLLCSKDNVIKFIFTFTHQWTGIVLELYCTQSSIQIRSTPWPPVGYCSSLYPLGWALSPILQFNSHRDWLVVM